jgi:hypothetical protein
MKLRADLTQTSAILRTLSGMASASASLKTLSRKPARASALPLGTVSGIAISVHSIHNGYSHDLKILWLRTV